MRTVRNITVAVEPELYRQTRKIAADYDSTVTDLVRYLLIVLPEAVKAARFPGGRPQFGLAAARAAASAQSANPVINPASPSTGKSEIPPCTPVNASQPHSLQQPTRQQPASLQDKHSSIFILKTIISKLLRAIL
jgi:hypothetical protein